MKILLNVEMRYLPALGPVDRITVEAHNRIENGTFQNILPARVNLQPFIESTITSMCSTFIGIPLYFSNSVWQSRSYCTHAEFIQFKININFK